MYLTRRDDNTVLGVHLGATEVCKVKCARSCRSPIGMGDSRVPEREERIKVRREPQGGADTASFRHR